MVLVGDNGYPTPEEAAMEGLPPQYVAVLGTRAEGGSVRVWLLTNDVPSFELYEVVCVREGSGWLAGSGHSGGFDAGTPPAILQRALELGWE
jgi:hypothetical protein